MATVESKIFQLLLAKSNAADAYDAVVRQYMLQRGTCCDKLFDKPKHSLTYDELVWSADTNPFSPSDIKTGINHLVEVQKIELVIIDEHIEYAYKRI